MADYIPIFLDWPNVTKRLKPAEKGRLIDALVAHANGERTDDLLQGNEAFVFDAMAGQVDRHLAYVGTKRSAGSRGGSSKGAQAVLKQTEAVLKQTEANNNNNKNNNENQNNNENENKNNSMEANASCSEPLPRSKPEPAPTTPSAFDIPLNDGSAYNVPQEDIEQYRGLYPAIDVEQEIRNMIGWCMGNPTKRKTRRGVGGFITTWLSRAQDKGGSRVGGYSPPVQAPDRANAFLEMANQYGSDDG